MPSKKMPIQVSHNQSGHGPLSRIEVIKPDWPLPATIGVAITTRYGGVSQQGYQSLNLAAHVGDDPEAVAQNRSLLAAELDLPQQPLWLTQVHGINVAQAGVDEEGIEADASVSTQPGLAAAVLTADCLPVLFYGKNQAGEPVVAAAHAGWRGLAAGVLEATLESMQCVPSTVSCWLGPAIGPAAFQVGSEVRAVFVAQQAEAATAFVKDHGAQGSAEKYLADIYQLARLRLQAAAVTAIYGGGFCTVEDQRFFSYRRAGVNSQGVVIPSGRMASLIWIKQP